MTTPNLLKWEAERDQLRAECESLKTLWTDMRVVLAKSRDANCLCSYGAAQVDAVEAANKILNVMPRDLTAERDQLRAELDAAKADTARLDWLERKDPQPYYSDGKWRIPYEMRGEGGFGGGVGEYLGISLRAAIDAARTEAAP